MAPPALARALRDARAQHEGGLSLRELHDRTGLAVGYLNRLERGRVSDPSPHALRKLAPALGLTYTGLMRLAGYL